MSGIAIEAMVEGSESLADSSEFDLADRIVAVVRDSPVAFAITTLADGRLIDVNDAFLHQFGFRRDEIVGHSTLDLDIWVDRTQRSRLLAEIELKGGVWDMETKLRTKSGELREMLGSFKVTESHGCRYLLS